MMTESRRQDQPTGREGRTRMELCGNKEQVRRAEEIRANVIRTMEGIAAMLKSAPGFDKENPAHAGNIEACTRRVDAVKSCQYAWDLIECFGSVRFTGDVYSDFRALQGVYLSKEPKSDVQRNLLMKFA
jgi:hypothetical protein